MSSQRVEAGQTTLSGDLASGTEKYNTPLAWVRPIAERLGGFDLDPCASSDSNLADQNIRNSGGLEANWDEYDTIWCNHPYGRGEPEQWLREAYECDAETVVVLSKADTSTDWFRDYLTRADVLCFPHDRITFVGEDSGADFPNVYGVFGACPADLLEWFASVGWVVDPARTRRVGSKEARG